MTLLGTIPSRRILIIGASGLVGRALCRVLPKADFLPTFFLHPVPDGRRFDVTSMELDSVVPRGAAFTHGIILSAESRVDPCAADPTRTQELNVEAPVRLAAQMLERGIRPVFLSSEYVFDGGRGHYKEGDEPRPNTSYGRQKLEAERRIAALGDGPLVLRLSKVVGNEPRDGSLLMASLEQLARGEVIRAAKDQIFSPIAAEDAAALIVAAMDSQLSGVYHLSGSEHWSRYELVKLLASLWAGQARIEPCSLDDIKLPEARPKNLSLDSSKLLNATRLRPRTMESYCREVVRTANAGSGVAV